MGKFSSQLLRGLPLCLGLTRDALAIFDPLRDVLDAFNPLGDDSGVLVSFTQLRVLLPFLGVFLNFLLHFLPFQNPLGIFEIYIYIYIYIFY